MRRISLLIASTFLLSACVGSVETEATSTTTSVPPTSVVIPDATTSLDSTTTLEATTTTVTSTTNTTVATSTTMQTTTSSAFEDLLQPGVLSSILEDAAERTGVVPDEVQVVDVVAQKFPDASLGCPEPGQAYAQVITPGFQVLVQSGGAQLDYRVDGRSGDYRLCQQ